ncbi:hypothetical protein [Hymenobacter coalescens]
MKKQLFSLALILGLSVSFAGASFAADDHDGKRAARREVRQGGDHDRKDQDRKDRGQRGAQKRQQRSEQLAKDLGLNSKQKAKVEQIFQEQHQQMQALRGRSGNDRSQQLSDAKRIHQDTDKKLKSALTKKQYAQFEAKRQERRQQMSQRRGERLGTDRRDFGGRS